VLLVGLAVRVVPWDENRFLEDEALYAYWGLQIASGTDPMLDLEPVDKPPLHTYAVALSTLFLGYGETAARLPSLLASLAGIALVYALGRELFGDERVGLLAAISVTLSPFDILFASTAFTDPLMTALVLAALLAALKDRPGAAGLLAAMAAAPKQQGIFFLPLVALVGLMVWCTAPARVDFHAAKSRLKRRTGQTPHDRPSFLLELKPGLARPRNNPWLRFAIGIAVVGAAVFWWDMSRAQKPGFLAQGFISYGGLDLVPLNALGERTEAWLDIIKIFWTSPLVNTLLATTLVGWLIGGLRGWWPKPTRIVTALSLFTLGYLALHIVIEFQVWDRYLLPLIPLLALLTAKALIELVTNLSPAAWRRASMAILSSVLILALSGPVLVATRSGLPVGGDHGAYDGIKHLATHLHAEAPSGAVLYHHWLGYHYRFYLYNAPYRTHWYPSLEDLTRDATIYRREPRYIAFPSWRDSLPAQEALAATGISLIPITEATRRDGQTSFRLYQMQGP
jgi:hypothetical protein